MKTDVSSLSSQLQIPPSGKIDSERKPNETVLLWKEGQRRMFFCLSPGVFTLKAPNFYRFGALGIFSHHAMSGVSFCELIPDSDAKICF